MNVQQQSQNATSPASDPFSNELNAKYSEMQGFLRGRTAYTILPTPLPDDQTSEFSSFVFTDTPTQDSVSVIDACLHNLYDVPRAKGIFDRLRASRRGDPILSERLYNSILAAYLEMASTRDKLRRNHWVEDACALYESMEAGHDGVAPTQGTYALMLLIWHRFNPDAAEPVSGTIELFDPSQLLQRITERSIPAPLVVADKAFEDSEEAAAVIKSLSKAAAELGLSKVITELGATEILGRQMPDPLHDVPEAEPVMRAKVSNATKLPST